MTSNEVVSRCASETEEGNHETSAIASIGRNAELRVVSGDGSTSFEHSETERVDGEATTENARSDPGTSGGRSGKDYRQSGTSASVKLGEGDAITFCKDQAESCRVEQTQSSKDNEVEICSNPQDRDAPGNDTVEHDKGARPTVSQESGNEGKDREAADGYQDRTQRVTESEVQTKSSIIVGVLKAEDLAGANSTTIFRMPKKSQTLRRYVRVRILCLGEGRDHRIAGQTSSVAVTGSTCCWGDVESRGEEIRLSTSKIDGDSVLEVEAWSDQSSNSGEGLLLGHGKINVREFEDSRSQWVGLDPKGRVEVWISTSTSHLECEGAEHSDRIAHEGIHGDERGERDGPRDPLDANDKGDVVVSAQAEPTVVSAQRTLTSPPWRRPLSPDFKNVLMTAGRGRASHNQKTKKPQTATIQEINGKSGDASTRVDFFSGNREGMLEERGGPVMCEEEPQRVHKAQAHQLSRSAKQGVQMMKDGFQARLLGARGGGKRPGKNRDKETEDAMSTETRGEGSLNVSDSLLTSDILKRTRSEPSNVECERDEQGTCQAQIDQENNEKLITDKPKGGSSDGDNANRRQRRSLLRDESADDDTPRGEGRERDGNGANNDSDADHETNLSVRRNSTGNEKKNVPKQARKLVAQIASPLDAMISVTAAASRLKSTWPSPDLTSTLKGFRRKKPKGDAKTDVASSPDPADEVSPAGPLGADQAGATATYHRLRNVFSTLPSKPVAVRVTVFRASLPEGLATRKLAGTIHRTAFIRLKIGDASAPTSAVQAEGRECRWGKEDEGEIVDIPIPSPNLSDVAASTLALEVLNKSSKKLGEDLLMGKTEVLVSDWLGKKGWAELDGSHQGGRVKLSVALKFSTSNGEVSDNALVAFCDAVQDKESRAGEDAGLVNTDPDAISMFTTDVGYTPQRMGETPRLREVSTESIENVTHQEKQASRRAGEGSRSNEGGNSGGFPVEGRSFSTKNKQSTSSQTISSSVFLGVEKRKIEAATRATHHSGFYADAAEGGCVRDTGDKSAFLEEKGVRVCTLNADEQELLEVLPRKGKTLPISTDALETVPSESRHRGESEMNRARDTRIDLAFSTASGASITNSRIEVLGANIEAASASLELSESHEQRAKAARQVIALTVPHDAERTTSNDKNLTALAIQSADHTEMLGRHACGSTATALDAAAAGCTRGQQAAHIAQEKSTEVDVNTTFPREHPEKSQQGHYTTCLSPGDNGTDRQINESVEKRRGALTTPFQVFAIDATMKASAAQMEDGNHATALAQIIKTRLDRAREIVRRRRQAVCSNRRFAPVDTRDTSGAAIVAVQARAAATIQGAFRGRTARRTIRLDRRSVVKIQAAYRGHMEQKEYVLHIARARRAKAEETRAQARRSRIAFVTQELHLLRGTPARQLLKFDEVRARACAARIQRLWRRYSEQDAGDTAKNPESHDQHSAITAAEMGRSERNTRVPVSDMAFGIPQLRVKNRRQAGKCFKGREPVSLESMIQRPGGTERDRRSNRRDEAENLMHWHDKASQLTAAFHQTRIHRRLAAKRRSERLARFRKVQDELLRPTKLCRLDRTGACEDNFEMAEPGHSQAPCLDEVACRNLNLAEEQTRRDRARRAHDLALAAAKSRKCWTVSLPPDIGYDELIDIRHVRPSWPTFSVRGRAPLEFVDGFVRNHNKHVGKNGDSPGDHQLHSDEASLWWYVHSAPGIHRTGLLQQDRVFAHLLERAKATSTRRKEHAERGERQHQSYVSRKRRTAIDEVIHQQQVASCQNLSYTRKRVTQEQRSAATLIQSYIRRFLGRKQALLLRTETKIFGALQILVKELRQPELDPDDTLAAILTDHTSGCHKKERGVRRTGRRSRSS